MPATTMPPPPPDERSATPGRAEIRRHGEAYSGFSAVSKPPPWWVFCPSSQPSKGIEWVASMPIVAVVAYPRCPARQGMFPDVRAG
jgi:hypothetical protein